jgi:hypothetical protein
VKKSPVKVHCQDPRSVRPTSPPSNETATTATCFIFAPYPTLLCLTRRGSTDRTHAFQYTRNTIPFSSFLTTRARSPFRRLANNSNKNLNPQVIGPVGIKNASLRRIGTYANERCSHSAQARFKKPSIATSRDGGAIMVRSTSQGWWLSGSRLLSSAPASRTLLSLSLSLSLSEVAYDAKIHTRLPPCALLC